MIAGKFRVSASLALCKGHSPARAQVSFFFYVAIIHLTFGTKDRTPSLTSIVRGGLNQNYITR